jgi:hypothetical protein
MKVQTEPDGWRLGFITLEALSPPKVSLPPEAESRQGSTTSHSGRGHVSADDCLGMKIFVNPKVHNDPVTMPSCNIVVGRRHYRHCNQGT